MTVTAAASDLESGVIVIRVLLGWRARLRLAMARILKESRVRC
jgi:hypothetical protein